MLLVIYESVRFSPERPDLCEVAVVPLGVRRPAVAARVVLKRVGSEWPLDKA